MKPCKKISASIDSWNNEYLQFMGRLSGQKYSPMLRILLAAECYITAHRRYDLDKDNPLDLMGPFYAAMKENKAITKDMLSTILQHGQRAWEHIKTQQNIPQKILIIEDEENFRDTLMIALNKQGYDVDTVSNGDEAIQRTGQQTFDLILSDIRLPGKDGVEAIEIIKNQSSWNPVFIIMTGFADENVTVRALKAGAKDYMRKPFEMDDLLTSIRKNLPPKNIIYEKKENLN